MSWTCVPHLLYPHSHTLYQEIISTEPRLVFEHSGVLGYSSRLKNYSETWVVDHFISRLIRPPQLLEVQNFSAEIITDRFIALPVQKSPT